MERIYLPESVERILQRISEACMRNKEPNAMIFEEFKASLEDETNDLLLCEEGEEDTAKILLLNEIMGYYDFFGIDNIKRIENDVFVQRGLRKRLEKLSIKKRTQKEALKLLQFINNALFVSWGQEDSHYKIKDFRLVESEEEFEEILDKYKEAQELTDGKNLMVEFTTIRVALVPMDRKTIHKKKGIVEDYKRFKMEHRNDPNYQEAIEMFDLWHDVRETAIYYIYAPKELKK